MKVYVTSRFKGAENKEEIEKLCAAVRAAKLVDFSFVRDVEHYKQTFDDPQELWTRARDEITACNALLIDVSDHPSGGRMVEAGIAYARQMPIIVVKRRGLQYKGLFDGIASTIIEYDDYKDLSKQLRAYDNERVFTVNDRLSVLGAAVALGLASGWVVARLFVPLGLLWIIAYWLVARLVLPSLRLYDRLVVYIPLILIWAAGVFVLLPLHVLLALVWAIGFWIVVLLVLKKLKFSL